MGCSIFCGLGPNAPTSGNGASVAGHWNSQEVYASAKMTDDHVTEQQDFRNVGRKLNRKIRWCKLRTGEQQLVENDGKTYRSLSTLHATGQSVPVGGQKADSDNNNPLQFGFREIQKVGTAGVQTQRRKLNSVTNDTLWLHSANSSGPARHSKAHRPEMKPTLRLHSRTGSERCPRLTSNGKSWHGNNEVYIRIKRIETLRNSPQAGDGQSDDPGTNHKIEESKNQEKKESLGSHHNLIKSPVSTKRHSNVSMHCKANGEKLIAFGLMRLVANVG